ncbi:beta-propeller fold lactonase family protein [Povalibacter sp.]|uniref:beta-propeller fold lactonase family protein n=1 Tax=Povalibacter sp. TaxID=1962978 RepID=UPI002F4026EC
MRLIPALVTACLACIIGAIAPAVHAQHAYVSNEDGHSVTVIDTQHDEVVNTIQIGKRPRGMKLDREGARLYVAVSGLAKCPPSVPDEECAKLERDLSADGIAVLDTATHQILKVLQAGSDPEQFAIDADGKRLFVANEDTATVSVIATRDGALIARIPVGREPEGIVMSPDGHWVLVTNESDSTVSFIDTGTLKVVKTVSVGKRPRDIAFTPDGGTAYVSGELDASLYRLSLQTAKPERVLQLGKDARPMAVVLDSPRNRLYLSTGRGGTVAVVAVPEMKLIGEVPVGTRPWGIALSQDGRKLYTANGPSNDVSVVDTTTLRVIRKIPVGNSPWGVVLAPWPPAATSSSRHKP